jgi:hypothetical protein
VLPVTTALDNMAEEPYMSHDNKFVTVLQFFISDFSFFSFTAKPAACYKTDATSGVVTKIFEPGQPSGISSL